MQPKWRICSLVSLAASTVLAGSVAPARLYEITTETGMPHLEQSLRYTTIRTRQCLARGDLRSAFPMLHHPSLAGCKLRERGLGGDSIVYDLICEKSAGTTGTATWWTGEHVIRGTLDVKLGGKNMTFYQRVTGTLIGDC